MLVNGVQVFLRKQGSGPPLLILHGWGASTESWLKVANELEKKFTVIYFDFPGFGKSGLPDSAWNVDDYTDFVLSLLKQSGIDKFYLLAHSFGARVAIKLASRFPERIMKLVMIGAAGVKPEAPSRWKVFLNGFMSLFKFVPGFKIGRKAYYRFVIRSTDYLKATGIMKEVFKKVVKEDLTDCLDKVKVKTLLIWGKDDKAVPSEDGKLMNQRIIGSKLDIVNTGHSPHLVIPKVISQKIIDFMYE